MRVVVPLEMPDMKGGMLQSVELLLRFLPGCEKIVLVPRGAKTAARMEAAGATVVQSALDRWTVAKSGPLLTARTFWTVRREIRALLTPSSVVLTNNLAAELLAGVTHLPEGVARVFVNRGNLYRGVSRSALRRSLRSTTACVATTSYQLEVLARDLEVPIDRLAVIPNGVDLTEIEITASHSKPDWYRTGRKHIGTLGFPSEGKNQELLIRSIALLRAASIPVVGVIAGSAGCKSDELYMKRLVALVRDLSLSDDIVFVPFTVNKARLYSGIDVLASTSLREGFGRTIVEAMAARRPVVALRAGGPETIIDDGRTGFLVSDNDPVQFASALKRVTSDPVLIERVTHCARRECEERYDARRVAEQYSALFETCLRRVESRRAAAA